MHVFVTGATGYIGTSVVTHLLERGHTVTGLVRSANSETKVTNAGAKALRGDLQDYSLLRDAVIAADAVIHAGFSHDDWSGMEKAFGLDRDAVLAMLGAMAGTNRPFIYTSGSGVLGDTGITPVDEDTVAAAPEMAALRPETENDVIKAALNGVQSIVIRAGLVYGRGGGGVMQMLMNLGRGVDGPRTIGPGHNVWSAVHIDDLAELYVLALEKGAAGSLFHAANRDLITFSDIAAAAAKPSKLGGLVKPIPLEDARGLLGFLADGLVLEKRINANRAMEQLDWVPSRPSIISEIELGSYAPSRASGPDIPVENQKTMINNFQVPHAATDKFLREWIDDLSFMSAQPGFIGGTLYRSDDDGARFRFVNVAHWHDMRSFEDARKAFFQHSRERGHSRAESWASVGIQMVPSTYSVAKKF